MNSHNVSHVFFTPFCIGKKNDNTTHFVQNITIHTRCKWSRFFHNKHEASVLVWMYIVFWLCIVFLIVYDCVWLCIVCWLCMIVCCVLIVFDFKGFTALHEFFLSCDLLMQEISFRYKLLCPRLLSLCVHCYTYIHNTYVYICKHSISFNYNNKII